MIFILLPLALLVVWNLVSCGIKVVGDFRSANPAMGVFGLLAMLGVAGFIIFVVAILLFGLSGI